MSTQKIQRTVADYGKIGKSYRKKLFKWKITENWYVHVNVKGQTVKKL